MSIDNVKVNIGNAEIGFETGKLALQAPGKFHRGSALRCVYRYWQEWGH